MPVRRQAGSLGRVLGPWLAAWLLGGVAIQAGVARAQDGTAAGPAAPGAGSPIVRPSLPPPTEASDAWSDDGPVDGPTPSGFFQVARASIFNPEDSSNWRPLSLSTLFSEGWDQPWIARPNGSGGAPWQGWINAADGNFYRLWFFSYTFTGGLAQGGNGHLGSYTLYTPLSRRLELITFIPFVASRLPVLALGRQGFPGLLPTARTRHGGAPTGFGDLAFTPRVMLLETQDLQINAQMVIQTPTGYRPMGAGQAVLTPGTQFWWNPRGSWVVRGGFNAAVGTNRQAGGTALVSQLAVGQTLTPHDRPLLGDFTYYLSTNVFNVVSASKTLVTLTPGFRTHLGKNWYLLGGVEVPVTGPRPYEASAIFWLMKTY